MKKKGKGLSFDQKRDRMLAIFHKNVIVCLSRKMSIIIRKLRNFQSRLKFLSPVSNRY